MYFTLIKAHIAPWRHSLEKNRSTVSSMLLRTPMLKSPPTSKLSHTFLENSSRKRDIKAKAMKEAIYVSLRNLLLLRSKRPIQPDKSHQYTGHHTEQGQPRMSAKSSIQIYPAESATQYRQEQTGGDPRQQVCPLSEQNPHHLICLERSSL